MKPLGLVVAMPPECRTLTGRRLAVGDCVDLASGQRLCLSGAGPTAAERGATALVESGAGALVSWGCAGALSDTLKPGDLLLPEAIIAANGSTTETDGAWREGLASLLATHNIPVHGGSLADSGCIVTSATDKRAVHQKTGAVALDMESAAIARVAGRHQLPFIAVRSIVDPAGLSLPGSVQQAFDDNGQLRIPTLLLHALQHPADWVGIIQLGLHFALAMKTLRRVAESGRDGRFALH